MSGMEEIKDILENNAYRLEETYIKSLPTKNGICDPLEIEINKSLSIVEAMDNLNHLVRVKQEYPKDHQSLVKFTTDMVVLDGKDYRELLELIKHI